MITLAQVRAVLAAIGDEAVNDQADPRVNRGLAPRYVEHGEPCCLVAVILYRLGFTVRQLAQFDTEPGRSGGGVVFRESHHPLTRRIEAPARVLLDYVQYQQDNQRGTWVQVADRALQRGKYTPDPANRRPYFHDRVADRWAYETFPWNEDSGQ